MSKAGLAELTKRIKALEAELLKAKGETESASQAAAEKARGLMQKKLEEDRAQHLKDLEGAEKDYKQQLEEQRKAAADKLANREENLRIQMSETKKKRDEERVIEVQMSEKKAAAKAEGFQKASHTSS